MNNKPLILVVEDDQDLADLLEYNILEAQFNCKVINDGTKAYNWLKDNSPAMLLLDIMLPGMEGLELCRRVRREKKDLPIIMLSARADAVDKVVGLELGADDYVTKPFNMRELLLRIKAVLRRHNSEEQESGSLTFGCLKIDVAAHMVFVDDVPLDLTATEFDLLLFLVGKAGRVQNRDYLLEQVWGYSAGNYARTVDTHMRRLRQKLGKAQNMLETVRGVGYRFNANL